MTKNLAGVFIGSKVSLSESQNSAQKFTAGLPNTYNIFNRFEKKYILQLIALAHCIFRVLMLFLFILTLKLSKNL